MTYETGERVPIMPPETKHPDDRARVPLEAALGVLPGVSGLVKLVNEFVPTQVHKSRSRWEGVISERTNEHSERLDEHDSQLRPTAELTSVAVQLAVALARAQGDGMAGHGRDLDELCTLLPNLARKAAEEAAFELNSHDLVDIQRAIGTHWWLRMTQRFYEQIYHQVMDWNSTTSDDARMLARLLLEDEAREWTPSLHEASGWEKRRFNPAFKVLLRLFPEGRASSEAQPDYPARSLSLLPEDYALLRRFVESRI